MPDGSGGGYRPLAPESRPLAQVRGLRKLCSYLHKTVCLIECF